MMINRYNITGDFDYDKDDFCIDEQQCDNGAWVKYEDVKHLLQNTPSNNDCVKCPNCGSSAGTYSMGERCISCHEEI